MGNLELVFNETTKKWEERPEPYITIEIETKEDYDLLEKVVAFYETRDDYVKVVHGRWIEKQERITMIEDDVDIYWVCSVCGTTEIGKTNYCHNCGSKMDGEVDGSA